MVIRLSIGAQIGSALRYNEQKVVQKEAHVLIATGFANNELAVENRNYTTSVLESQCRKNTKVTKPTLHFSLSLHPTEQVSDEKFKAMAHQFMGEMGYRNQPYIIYRHHDTAHPHIHIVTTCIDETGQKISDAFIKRRTNAVRQKLEVQFSLIKAQGRGRAIPLTQEMMPAKAPEPIAYQKKEQLETILRQAFQQGSFYSIDEFRNVLRKKGVHTTLHRSTISNKPMRGISYQLIDTDGKATMPRIKASDIGDWVTWNSIEKLFGKSYHQKTTEQKVQPNQLDFKQYKTLGALLSEQLRDYKKEQRVYYDSILIENFPTTAMQVRLTGLVKGKLTEQQVEEAVRRFEAYKRSQLPEIIKREQLAFMRTMETYSRIASEIAGSAINKLQYFSALSVSMDKQGLISSPTNRHLSYQIGADCLLMIQSENGIELEMPRLYSPGERTVMLMSASKKDFKESYYDVRAEQLARILKPDLMSSIHTQLNKNYVARLTKGGSVVGADQVRYFYQRGIMIDKRVGEGKAEKAENCLIRFKDAPLVSGIESGSVFEKQIPYLNLERWRGGLLTEAGQYMVALAQGIDQQKQREEKTGNQKNEAKSSGQTADELGFLRERIHRRDPALASLSDEDLLTVLEKRSQQGQGWVRQIDEYMQRGYYMNESAINANLIEFRATELFGYEQTGKYKNVGKGVKKRSKGREL